jgi:hypothetical protein
VFGADVFGERAVNLQERVKGESEMLIWLGGTGRSDADLERVLQESDYGLAGGFQERRVHGRIQLSEAHGELVYQSSRTPCMVLNLSETGCSLEVSKPFRHGALASVEVVLPVFEMILHIGGVIQWVKHERRIGVRFSHVSSKSKLQLECLMDCMFGQCTAKSVQDSIASHALNLKTGDVLAVQPPAPPLQKQICERLPYDSLVHCGEELIHVDAERGWPVSLRSPDGRFQISGFFVDLSLGGCTVRTEKPFVGEVQDSVEVNFELKGLHFLIRGVTQAIYDPYRTGIRFSFVGSRKRDELAQILKEFCAENEAQLRVT